MDKRTKEIFDSLYQEMLLDKEKNLSSYVDDSNQLKNFEITQSNEEFDVIIRMFEKNELFMTDIAIIWGEKVLQKLFYTETRNLNDCEIEYNRLIGFAQNNSIDIILEESKKSKKLFEC